MDFEALVDLEGNEFLTTYFSTEEKSVMILATGDNLDGKKEGPTFVFLYFCIDGEVERGIDSFVFKTSKEAHIFINKLPEMSAIDFIVRSIGLPPEIRM